MLIAHDHSIKHKDPAETASAAASGAYATGIPTPATGETGPGAAWR
jgi:hypothetical protein